MTTKFNWARPAEILRSDEKDRQHVDSSRRELFDSLGELLGLRHIVRHHQAIAVANALIYYSLTTLRDRQTLGEQYVNMVRCTPEGHPSSFVQRAILLLEHLPWKQLLLVGNEQRQRFASIASQLHLIHFYLFGQYSSFFRRFSRSRYALLRDRLDVPSLEWSFKLIAVLFSVKLLRELVQKATITSAGRNDEQNPITNNNNHHNGDSSDDNPRNSATLQCGLCGDPTCECTVTRCGHIFCWTCITEWAASKSHCPLCRTVVYPEQLVRVLNR